VPTIKRMLDQSLSLDIWNQAGSMFAHQPEDVRAVAAAAEADPSRRAGDASQQGSAPVPAQQQAAMRHPPPGFGPPQHPSNMQQPVLGIPAAARQEQYQEPFRADAPIPQAPAGYYPHGSQVPFAPQQQPQQQPMPQRTPSFNPRQPADGAQWQGCPPSPPSPQQPGFFAFSPAQPFGPCAQQQQGAPRPPFAHAPYAAYAGGPPAFDNPPAGFSPGAGPPAAGGYAPWQQQQQQYSLSQQEALRLYAMQQMAQQRKQAQQQHSPAPAAAAVAFNKQTFRGYHNNSSHPGGDYNSAYHAAHLRPPAGAGAAPGLIGPAPPPPPRQGAPMQGQHMNATKAGQHAGYAPGGYVGHAAFGQVGQPATYTRFDTRHGSAMQPGVTVNGGGESLGERSASNAGAGGVDANPLIAALPRSSSALWESVVNSPRASASNLRKSSSCDSFPSLTADTATAQDAPGHAADVPLSVMPFTPAVLLTHDGARATHAAASKLGMRSSSGSGSFASALGRASIRSLAWDPMLTLSSGGGARPSAGGAGVGSIRTPGKPCAMAAKVPLIYTPATLLEHGIWASDIPVGSGCSNGFGTSQLLPDQLEVMFRRLRADVRGPDARPI
jgi:hypothetical protein